MQRRQEEEPQTRSGEAAAAARTNGEGQECDAIMARRGARSRWLAGPFAVGERREPREPGEQGGGGAMGPGEPMEPREQREPTEPRKLKEPRGGGRDGKKKMAASQRLVGPFAVDERLAQRGPTEPTEPRGPGAATFHVTSSKLTICASGRTLVPADEIADIRWPPLARQTPGGSDRHDRAELAPRARFNRAVGERCFCHSRQKTRYDVRSRGAFTNVPGSWAASP
ncbi:unnamed protein product [Lampetra planeri]